jgi:hypothetical protein
VPGASVSDGEQLEKESGGTWYNYAVVRVVPHVEREEFVNVGVIVFAPEADFLAARIELPEDRLLLLAPGLDLDELRTHLHAFEAVAAGDPTGGPVAALIQSQRFHWLTAPRSTMIQTSAVHVGHSADPAVALEALMSELVR